jgi:hypothetical protein
MKPRNHSTPQDQADLSKGRSRFREDFDASGAIPNVVRGVVLGDKLDLLKLLVRREQATAHLVN